MARQLTKTRPSTVDKVRSFIIRRGTRVVFAVALAMVLTVGACGGPPVTEIRADGITQLRADPTTVLATSSNITYFAADLYRQLAEQAPNFSFSPIAVSLSLAVAQTGATGSTEGQLNDVLHASTTPDFGTGLGTLVGNLGDRTGEFRSDTSIGSVKIQLPASMWIQQGTVLKDSFIEDLARQFGLGVNAVDFRSDPTSALRATDSWIKNATRGAISEPLENDVFNPTTQLALVSGFAIHAPWNVQFGPAQPATMPFHRLDGSTVESTMMSVRSQDSLSFAEGEHWQAVSIPIVGGDLSMVLIIPRDSDLTTLEQSLDGALITAVFSALRPTPIKLFLPQFRFDTNLDLGAALRRLGMTSAFILDEAQFDGISASEPIAISSVVHRSKLSIDDRGTGGGAATVVEGGPNPDFEATSVAVDKPFIVAIRDDPTGALLLLGRVADPSM